MYDCDRIDRGGYAHLENGQMVYDLEVRIDYNVEGEIPYLINGEVYTEDEYDKFCETNVKYYDNLISGWNDYSYTIIDAYYMELN